VKVLELSETASAAPALTTPFTSAESARDVMMAVP
jgi:hypothetical protein